MRKVRLFLLKRTYEESLESLAQARAAVNAAANATAGSVLRLI